MSCFLIAGSIICLDLLSVIVRCKIICLDLLRVIFQWKFSPGLNCLENKSVERRDLSVEVLPDFPALFKKRSALKF